MRWVALLAVFSVSAAQDSSVVMFLGDSYTQFDYGGGYKAHVFHHLDSLGYLVKYVGRDSTASNAGAIYFGGGASSSLLAWDWPRTQMWHEGVGSKEAYHYATGTGSASPGTVTDAVTVNPPDILFVYIGLNDVADGGFSTATIRNNIDSMLTQAWRYNANMRIILSNLAKTKNTAWYDSIDALNAKTLTMAQAKQASGKFLLYVDMDAATDSTDFDGSSHPSASYGVTKWSGGNRKIALALAPYIATAIDSVLAGTQRGKYLLLRRR